MFPLFLSKSHIDTTPDVQQDEDQTLLQEENGRSLPVQRLFARISLVNACIGHTWRSSICHVRRKSLTLLILSLSLIIISLAVFPNRQTSYAEVDILHYVDPTIGTRGDGHVFAGAGIPFGMAKPVADVLGDAVGAFAAGSAPVSGFSHLHDSGTGGAPSLGNFPIFLHANCTSLADCQMAKHRRAAPYDPLSLVATPGYFSIVLDTGVAAEMTASSHVAMYRFAIDHAGDNPAQPLLLADISDLPRSGGVRSIRIDSEIGRISGEGTFSPSFGQGTYQAYICADFKGAQVRDFGVFNDSTHVNATTIKSDNAAFAPDMGVFARFQNVMSTDHILVRVGLSWLSVDQACQNAADEVGDWDFDRVRHEAVSAWREKLAPVRVSSEGIGDDHLRNFWSGISRAFLSPQDYSGENQLWASHEPYFDSYYCIWDTFRTLHPFLTIVDPGSQSRMVRSLLNIYSHTGWLPDCRMSFCKGYTQGGSNADVVIADAFAKKLPHIDRDLAYEAIVKDAEQQPSDWAVEGRGDLIKWKQIGFIPASSKARALRTRSISRTVEYAYNDFCIAQVANTTGRHADYTIYAQRASNWKNIFKDDHESMGFTGFAQPRFADGNWGFQNATLCSPLNNFDDCYLVPDGHETYEGSSWQYSFFVPGDMAGLISRIGGPNTFVRRLDTLHDSGLLYMGDEQALLTPFLYHYAGRPGLSSKRIHALIPSIFNDTKAGIPGNDDGGAMGTFVALSMMGIFPNAGQDVYLIVPPFFANVNITSPLTGKSAVIRNVNFDPSYRKIFVQHATLNGVPYQRNWIDHQFLLDGGVLELHLGSHESAWGTRLEDLPPSLSTSDPGIS